MEAYNLIHITTGGEYKTPLVASQLFDQAECQAADRGNGAPAKVGVWIIEPMREMFDSAAKAKIKQLQQRCPHISISMVGGINRLNNWPVLQTLILKRRKLNTAIPVVYHCRGESAAEWALKLKEVFPQDKVVFDLRGFWPAEMLYNRGIYDVGLATGKDKEEYDNTLARLQQVINRVDNSTTVSEALRSIMIELGASQYATVVPCCVKTISTGDKRAHFRSKWNIAPHEVVIAYSGTTAAYQHIEDLTVPFLKKLMERNSNVRLLILTPDLEKFKVILRNAGITGKVILESLPQSEVADALTAADIGVLIRKTTLVNKVANPVKVAEYLASGLALIVEYGIGGIPEVLYTSSVAKGTTMSQPGGDMDSEADAVNEWITGNKYKNGDVARQVARDEYSWPEMIKVHRETYERLLSGQKADAMQMR